MSDETLNLCPLWRMTGKTRAQGSAPLQAFLSATVVGVLFAFAGRLISSLPNLLFPFRVNDGRFLLNGFQKRVALILAPTMFSTRGHHTAILTYRVDRIVASHSTHSGRAQGHCGTVTLDRYHPVHSDPTDLEQILLECLPKFVAHYIVCI